MKNGKKFLFVMAASVLALITGCQNNSSSTSSSSETVTSSQVTTSEVSTSEVSSTTSETPTTSEVISSVEESTVSSVDSTTSEASSSEVTSSETTSSEVTSSGVASSEVTSNSSSETSSSEEHVHAYGNWEIVKKPTLTEAGTAKRTCECNDVDLTVVPALSNTEVWSVKSTSIPADHFKGGVTIYESVYGEVTVTSLKGEHDFGAWNIVTKPTLTTGGKAERVCSSDGFKEEVNLPVLSETTVWSVKSEEPATHLADGTKIYTSKYGEVPVVLPKGEHTYGSWKITTKPTETATGKAEKVCSVDNHKVEVDVPALSEATVWKVQSFPGATHADEGKNVYTSIYGEVEIKIPAGEHVYGAWKITTEPTATATGKAKKTCTVTGCTHVEEVTLPALNDTTVWKAVETAPTHTEAGYTTYKSVYGEVKVDGEPATGHTEYGDWTLVDKPTTTVTGSATRTCSCGYVDEVEVPVLTDTTVWTAVVTKPTHTEAGYTTYTSVYGEVEVKGEPATGHTASGKYTAVTEDGVVSIFEVCEDDDGGYVGDAVKTMESKVVSVTYEIDFTSNYSWTVDPNNPNKYISGNKGVHSSTSKIVINITKNGTFVFDWTVSSESTYDKLTIKKGSTNLISEQSGVKKGTINQEVVIGDVITIEYKKDNTTSSNDDQATIILPPQSFSYSALTLNANGGTSCDPLFIENGSIVGDLPTPTQEGKYFEGWYTDADCTTAYNGEKLSGDTTLYAKWSDAQTVTFHVNGGESIDDVAFQIGTTPVMPEDPLREGYYFLGWYTDEALEEKYVSGNKEASFDLYAKWSEAQTVTFHTNGGELIDDVAFQIGTTPVMPEDPVREGYYFIGWYTDEALKEKYVSENKEASFDLYAKWIAVKDAHALYGNYAGFKFKLNSLFSPSDSYVELAVDVEGNFALRTYFSGYVNGTFGAVSDGKVSNETVGIANVYEDGNVIIMSDTKTISSSTYLYVLIKDAAASKTGVKGKCCDEGKFAFVSFSFNSKDLTIMVDRTNGVVYYDVSIKGENGNSVSISDLDKNLFLTVYNGDTLIKDMHYKEGTAYDELFEKEVEIDDYVSSDDVYYGLYTLDANSLVLSGTGYAKFSVIGSAIYSYEVVEANVVYVYYSQSDRYLITLDTENKTFTYAVRKVNVTFDFGYEVDSVEKTVSTEFLYDIPTDFPKEVMNPTREGYVFKGWYTNSEFTGSPYTRSSVKENTKYYAKWVETVSVTVYNNNGSEKPFVSYFEKGTTPELTSPTKDGYVFVGWYTDEALTEKYVPENKETDVTVYAKYVGAPFYVGTFKGANFHDSNWGKNTNSTSTDLVVNITADGSVSGKVTSTWTLESYDEATSKLTLGNGNKFCVIETANGIVFGLADYDNNLDFGEIFWNNYVFYAKANGDDAISFDDIYFNNGYNMIIKITVGEKVAYVYTDGINKAVYADVTFTDFSGNAIAYDDIYSSTSGKNTLTSELVIKQGEVVVARVKASTNDTKYGYVFDDGKGGTYSGSVNGKNSSVVLDGFRNATINAEEAEPVVATYSFDNEGKLVLTINSKEYKFNVGEENALTQILDGLEGTYTYGELSLVLTGYGVATLGDTNCTYDVITGTKIKVVVGEVETVILLDTENKTASDIITLEGTYTAKYNFYCGWAQYEATTTLVFTTDGKCKISLSSPEHDYDHYDYECVYDTSFTGSYDYVIVGTTITLTKGDNNFVFTLAGDKLTITLVSTTYPSSSQGMFPASTSFAKK